MTPIVREILANYESDNPGVKANLARILMQGRLGGTGKLVSVSDVDWATIASVTESSTRQIATLLNKANGSLFITHLQLSLLPCLYR